MLEKLATGPLDLRVSEIGRRTSGYTLPALACCCCSSSSSGTGKTVD
ncbi:MAG: hypothetical protein ACRDLK_09925 [Gaiellaceae bacterium]